jgi:hypothetical protein
LRRAEQAEASGKCNTPKMHLVILAPGYFGEESLSSEVGRLRTNHWLCTVMANCAVKRQKAVPVPADEWLYV